MKYLLFFTVLVLLQSCGTNQFAKRKYTKGIYRPQHGYAKTNKIKSKKEASTLKELKHNNGVLTLDAEENPIRSEQDIKPVNNKEIASKDGFFLTQKLDLVDFQETMEEDHTFKEDIQPPPRKKGLDKKVPLIFMFITAGTATILALFVFGSIILEEFWLIDFILPSFVGPFSLLIVGVLALTTLILGIISYTQTKTTKAKISIIISAAAIGLCLLFALILL